MDIPRPYWVARLAQAWRKAPIVWLSGVRRTGKTTLARGLSRTTYLNCDLPSTTERLADPARFLASVSTPFLVLDEVHQLADPSRILKISADEYPALKVLATGSSTLAATSKFRDTLAGRKRVVHLLPVLAGELPAFGIKDLRRRLLHGGLPAALLGDDHDPEIYAEWLDSFFARDVQELFHVQKRGPFLSLVEWLLRQSGGLTDVSSLARATSLSRPTVMSYLDILQTTHVVTVLRPYHDGGRQELLHQPKVYAFDTGFVAWSRGWSDLRPDECGLLWEHVVLESLQSSGEPKIHYWRDKQQHEVDFAVPRGRGACHVLECKWRPSGFEPRGIRAFRSNYPKGRNFLVTPDDSPAHTRTVGDLEITFCGLSDALNLLSTRAS